MDNIQQLLQVSAKLYQHLASLPEEEKRDEYIEKINSLLDERGLIMEHLLLNHFVLDINNKSHAMLAELDKGIRERLNKVMKVIQNDLKGLQNAKKHEQQYMNPYANVQVMDGRYYDKKN
ncbi:MULTISPECIES: flagellar protein FliT [Solibacillus]|uniref:Flagellar protein FliT n=1 Tax=Solibacillus merdavium TaxID=2762218 RepID=A0ABR8XHR8_9BACL|nr:flagellar protein FliT [Solibacillus merdavium]MBD8031479.1 flagellar protein FliT [Solibacillus merdavium]